MSCPSPGPLCCTSASCAWSQGSETQWRWPLALAPPPLWRRAPRCPSLPPSWQHEWQRMVARYNSQQIGEGDRVFPEAELVGADGIIARAKWEHEVSKLYSPIPPLGPCCKQGAANGELNRLVRVMAIASSRRSPPMRHVTQESSCHPGRPDQHPVAVDPPARARGRRHSLLRDPQSEVAERPTTRPSPGGLPRPCEPTRPSSRRLMMPLRTQSCGRRPSASSSPKESKKRTQEPDASVKRQAADASAQTTLRAQPAVETGVG